MVMTGITLFAYVDGFESANILGVLLSVGSAVGAAFYKVLHPPPPSPIYSHKEFGKLIITLQPTYVLHFNFAEQLIELSILEFYRVSE